MEITARALLDSQTRHGVRCAFSPGVFRCSRGDVSLHHLVFPVPIHSRQEHFLKVYLLTMVVLAWAAVLTGAYVIYPWYRAVPPPRTTDLQMFPQRLLMSSPTTIGWHSLGMEWKKHIAWFVPISITTVAFVFIRYGRDLKNHLQLRAAVLCFAVASFVSAGIADFCGAMINKCAPVQGGHTIQLRQGGEK
jgi:hypothetical protein